MKTNLKQLALEVLDPNSTATRTPLKQWINEGFSPRIHVTPLLLVLCIAGLLTSCGAGEDTTIESGYIGSDSETSINEDSGNVEDIDLDTYYQADEPPETSGPVELVTVPDVIGLSSDEAKVLIEAAGLRFGASLHDARYVEIEHDTVTAVDPSPGTPVPIGSGTIVDIYLDNHPDTSPISSDDNRRNQISAETRSEFGDRFAWTHWDETTGTYTVRIIYLSTSEAERIQTRYNDETFAVEVVSAAITLAELDALNDSTKDVALYSECASINSAGISMVSWSVFVNFAIEEADVQSTEECVSETKQAVLANAANFAKERSIHADPAELVRFTSSTGHN